MVILSFVGNCSSVCSRCEGALFFGIQNVYSGKIFWLTKIQNITKFENNFKNKRKIERKLNILFFFFFLIFYFILDCAIFWFDLSFGIFSIF